MQNGGMILTSLRTEKASKASSGKTVITHAVPVGQTLPLSHVPSSPLTLNLKFQKLHTKTCLSIQTLSYQLNSIFGRSNSNKQKQ